ncbi:type II toxin-antitoxin system RelE/ParE family toxin [Polaromonas sp.]|uniref:type II toxin-antitoxin system RelE/ParE family toxin n=1 Tax=Polaromonas sp. TaxID=1869339 RepID=UPI0013BA8CB9|nr:type II toxin-antitoxin system RelE/ParE family toxin [Polaromonas sp.]NDP62019.1 type II toxin-antitoxin system RelE/ParE family toxin [Polaromonas sp.]
MSRIVLAAQVRADFDRIFDFLFEYAPDSAATRIEAIIAAIDILQTSPLIGRPMAFGQRELVIATGSSGYLALYRYDPTLDTAFVLAVRSQREHGYKKG